jgi:photosystem II stability/assembly factor-like uncharacterized protein
VFADLQEPVAVYAMTQSEPGSRQGFSFFAQQDGIWEPIRHDISKARPTSLVVAHTDTGSRLYVSLYARGILRSEDGGVTWELLNRGLPSLGLTSLVGDPYDPNTLYAGTDDWRGVLTTSDGGESWEFFDYGAEIRGAEITKMAFTIANGGALIAGTEDGRILVHLRDSSDWQLRHGLSKGAIRALAVGGPNASTVYAGTSRGIVLRSQDGGANWDVLGQISSQLDITALAIVPTEAEQVYAATYGSGGYTVWKSEDMGLSWDMVRGEGLPRTRASSLVVRGEGNQQLLVGIQDGLFASDDGGATFEREPLTAPLAAVQDLVISPRHSAPVYAVAGGMVYINQDGRLRTWIHGTGLRAEEVRTLVVDPDNPNVAFAGVLLLGEWSVFSTKDGGQSWRQTTPPPLAPFVPDTTALALAKTHDNQTVLYAGTVGCGILRSNDGGRSWETFGRARCDEAGHGDMPSDTAMLAVDAVSPDLVYAAATQEFFRSTDGGYTWERRDVGVSSPIMDMVTDSVEPKLVYLVAGADGFWYSRDAGVTWQKPDDQPFERAELTALEGIPEQASNLIVGASNGGVWTTSDGGKTWRSIREDLAVGQISSAATSTALEGRILVASLRDGIALYQPGRLFGSTQ